MAKSRIIQAVKKADIKAARKLLPSKKLEIAAELSDLCIELKRSGEKGRPHGRSRTS